MKKMSKMVLGFIGGLALTLNTAFIVNADWKAESGKWWFATSNGYITGWDNIAGKWYYFDENGWMKTGWQQVDGKWYYLKNSGEMVTGWQKIEGENNWYYFETSGAMRTEDLLENGITYHFEASGKCLNPLEGQAEIPENVNPYVLGTWNGHTFISNLLNLQFKFPEDISIMSKFQIEQMLGGRIENTLFNDGNKAVQENLENYESGYDFCVLLPDETSNIQLLWENIALTAPGREISIEQYMEVVKNRYLAILNQQIEYIKKEENVNLGGQSFLKLSISLKDIGYQDFYVIEKGNFIGVIIATYTPQSTETVQEILNSAAAVN